MGQSLASLTKTKKLDHGKSSHKTSVSLPVTTNSGVNSLLHSEASDNSQSVKSVNVKTGCNLLQNIPVSVGGPRVNNLNDSTSGAVANENLESVNNNVVVTTSASTPKMQGHITLGQSNVLAKGQTESVIRGVSSCAISVPPGFQNLTHIKYTAQEQVFSQIIKPGTHGHGNLSYITKSHVPSNLANPNHTVPVSQSAQPQEKKVQQNLCLQQEEQLHSQQITEPDRQWRFWQNDAMPQQGCLNSKAQKQDGENRKKYQITSTTSSQSSQSHQQQYPYSISPAALFHMASQAAGGQISAVLLPSSKENNTPSRPGLPTSTTAAVGTTGSGAPPGFSAPVPINYHGQQVDALPMNKLLLGSSVFRSSVSQADGQSAAPNTASQPFLPVSGPMPGIYVSAHTPHTYSDPSLNQRHPVFETRHFLSQQVTQGLHQNVAQGLPQGVTATVPPGMQAGTSVSLPPPGLPAPLSQGISNSVPQALAQGVHQNLQSGMSQVNLGSAVSQGMQAVPIGHPFPPQHTYPQQGYQVGLYFCMVPCMYLCIMAISCKVAPLLTCKKSGIFLIFV